MHVRYYFPRDLGPQASLQHALNLERTHDSRARFQLGFSGASLTTLEHLETKNRRNGIQGNACVVQKMRWRFVGAEEARVGGSRSFPEKSNDFSRTIRQTSVGLTATHARAC